MSLRLLRGGRGRQTPWPAFARGRARPYRRRPRRASSTMRLVSTPFNPTPPGASLHPVRTADGVLLRTARWTPPHGARGTVAILPAGPNSSRNITRRSATCSTAACRWRSSTGAARAARRASSRTRAKAISTTSRSTSATSPPSSARCSRRLARSRGSASPIRWARRSRWRSRAPAAARSNGWRSPRR